MPEIIPWFDQWLAEEVERNFHCEDDEEDPINWWDELEEDDYESSYSTWQTC